MVQGEVGNELAVTRSRFAGAGHGSPSGCRHLEAIKNDYHLENLQLHPLAFISGSWPFVVGTHVVGPLQVCHAVPRAMGRPGMAGSMSCHSPAFRIFSSKIGIFGVESMIILCFLGIFSLRTSLDSCMGCSEPRTTRVEVDFGRWEKLTCHRIDELFKPNWPPETRK